MNRDLSHSDFAGLELQATRFSELHSFIGDNRVSRYEQEEEGMVLGAAKWLVIGFVLTLLAISAGLWAGS